MAYLVWNNGAVPDPYTIYPAKRPICGAESPPDPRIRGKYICTRQGPHPDGEMHVARGDESAEYPVGKLLAVWDQTDEGKKKPDAYLDQNSNPEQPAPSAANRLTKEKLKSLKRGDLLLVLPPNPKEADANSSVYQKAKPGDVVEFLAFGAECGCTRGPVVRVKDKKGQEYAVCHSNFAMVGSVADRLESALKLFEEGENMAKKKNAATDVEKAEIAYSEKVTFRVDEGKEIEIRNEDEAILWLNRRKEEREKEIAITENISGSYPSDGMIALARVLRREYGFTKFDSPSPFGTPLVFTIPVGCKGQLQDAPWGKFTIPGLSGFVATSINMDKTGQPVFQLVAKIKNKDKDKVKKLADLVRADLKLNSVYKGKAIKVEFPDFRKVAFDPSVHVPGFLDVSGADPNRLVFSREVANAVETSIFTPIEYAAQVKEHVGTLKRGVLLGGKPGTGKTLAAYVTARKCEENGWTFIYLASTGDLAQAIGFAKMYQPAVIFAEDLDSIVNTFAEDGDRDEGTMAVLNTLDGIDSKNSDVMVVFTTNYPEKLPEAMTRPGRLDAIITVLPPDTEAVDKLIRLYANGLMDEFEELHGVAESLAGQIPAVIKEVVDRSKLVAIRHTSPGCPLRITAQDLGVARDSMVSHLRMLNEKRALPPSDIEKAANVVMAHVMQAMAKASEPNGDDWNTEPGVLANPVDKDARLVRQVQAQLPMPGQKQ